MKKLMFILLVGLGMSFSAQSQNRCSKDTTQLCSMDSIQDCKKDSAKKCSMNITQKTEVNVENNYRYYGGYDDVYYYPHYIAPLWYTPHPWYWPQSRTVIIHKNHKDINHKFDQAIREHRNNNITDGKRDNKSSIYKRPVDRGQMRGVTQRPPMPNRPPMQQNRPQMQQSRPMQHYVAPPTQRQTHRRGPSVEIEDWMMNDTYLEN